MRAIDADKLLRDIEKYHVSDGKFQHWVQIQPTIEPERKKGEWIPMFDGKFHGGAYWFKCSECSRVVPDVRNGGWNFCPKCGAKMKGGKEE